MADDDLRALYQDLILDHGKKPRNFRVLDPANREALGHNPLCGDKIMLRLFVDDAGLIRDAAFQGSGCAISTAAASIMTDMVKGKSDDEARALLALAIHLCTDGDAPGARPQGLDEDDRDRLQALAGVRHFPVRVKCATLSWRALEAALTPAQASKPVATES